MNDAKGQESNFPKRGTNYHGKFGFFFSLFIILISNSVFAFPDKPSSENVVDSSIVSSVDQTEGTVIRIAEGTSVYGIDNFSQTSKPLSSSIGKGYKKHVKKKVKVVVKAKKEVQIENKIPKQEITAQVSKDPSDSSFQIGNNYIKVGTITTNNNFKSAELIQTYDFVIPILYNKKFYYTYSFPFIKSITDRYNFTRPPPAILS